MGDERNVYFEPAEQILLRTENAYQTEVDAGTASYSGTLLSLVANFDNDGVPEGFNAQSMAGKSKRGEEAVQLFGVINPATQAIEQVGFKAHGSLATIGCASAACMLVEGRTPEEALGVCVEDVREAVDSVPADKAHALYFAVCAIRGLVGDYLARAGATLADIDAAVPCEEYSTLCMMCEHCSLRDMRIDKAVDALIAGGGAPSASAPAGIASTTEAEAQAEAEALARVFDDVRAQSASSALVSPTRWAAQRWVPAHMTSDQFEMFVFEYLEQWQQEHPEALSEDASGGASEQTRARPASRFASRGVGVPRLFAEDNGGSNESRVMPPTARSIQPASTSGTSQQLNVAEGCKLVEIEGEWAIVEDDTASDTASTVCEIHPEHIRALVGAHSYYLYSDEYMTDAYAHWAFLAAEDNPLVTFADCVREDSHIYPRPLARTALANPPFSMSAAAVDAAWSEARQLPDYEDIKRTVASNGAVYFYSTRYLAPARANALAEWDAVGRHLNV